MPLHDSLFEPFAAAWHRSALPELQAALATGRSLQKVCSTLQAEGRLQPDALSVEETKLLQIYTIYEMIWDDPTG